LAHASSKGVGEVQGEEDVDRTGGSLAIEERFQREPDHTPRGVEPYRARPAPGARDGETEVEADGLVRIALDHHRRERRKQIDPAAIDERPPRLGRLEV